MIAPFFPRHKCTSVTAVDYGQHWCSVRLLIDLLLMQSVN